MKVPAIITIPKEPFKELEREFKKEELYIDGSGWIFFIKNVEDLEIKKASCSGYDIVRLSEDTDDLFKKAVDFYIEYEAMIKDKNGTEIGKIIDRKVYLYLKADAKSFPFGEINFPNWFIPGIVRIWGNGFDEKIEDDYKAFVKNPEKNGSFKELDPHYILILNKKDTEGHPRYSSFKLSLGKKGCFVSADLSPLDETGKGVYNLGASGLAKKSKEAYLSLEEMKKLVESSS